ncbi:MAG: hypothetical protein U5K27_15230 [Desulfotignum sp.]|nr:hypothetical protein [Desulfotignum sp.]
MMVPDLILYNATLYSQGPIPFLEERSADSNRRPPLTALATAGNRITALGDDDTLLAMAGPDTRVLNLDHHLVLPGFHRYPLSFL